MELTDFEKTFMGSVMGADDNEKPHRFSLRYKMRKRKIIGDYERSLHTYEHKHGRLKPKYIIIAIVLAAILAACGFGIYITFEGFRVREFDTHSILYIDDDCMQGTGEIEKKFYIDMDMSEYEIGVIDDDFLEYWLEYKKDDVILSIAQASYLLISGSNIRLNTENAMSAPQEISINGWNGMWFQLQNGAYYYIFNTGEYIIEYVGNLPKEDMENIVKSTKFNFSPPKDAFLL